MCAVICAAFICPSGMADEPLPIYGPSVIIDPSFSYYRNRTVQSIAAEVRANGYTIVRYVLTADSNLDPALVSAFQRENIGVWYLTFGNGTYSTKDLPEGWQAWKMVTRTDLEGGSHSDGFTRLCLNNSSYRSWKKSQIARTLARCPFQGVDIAEPHWPEYPGVESPAYACFCPSCLAAFQKMFPGETALPNIIDAGSPRSPARNPGLWTKWLAFRQTSLTTFLDDLVNGHDGVREEAPGVKVSVWTLALAGKDGMRSVQEDSGEDACQIVGVVKPDLHCLQTHWPDWLRPDLKPHYVDAYAPFIQQIRRVAPNLPLMIQADIGSKQENRRSWEWIKAFERACARLGADSTTLYEYSLGRYMYTDPPRITEVRTHGKRLELRFTKRLEASSAADVSHYQLAPGTIVGAEVDGNLVLLSVTGVEPGTPSVLTARGLADAPDRRFFHDHPLTVLRSQTVRFTF
ncbi:MAG: hypothetical protein JSV19_08530 [Phycisphaerales bacterium]|nr:MAG: hypothetical protein JSV19_08530 [Phycisphaerales bacterium]